MEKLVETGTKYKTSLITNNANANVNAKNLNNNIGIEEADSISNWLAEKLNSPQSREFYCKVAYTLSKPKIHELLSKSLEKSKTTPARYFSFLASIEMKGTK